MLYKTLYNHSLFMADDDRVYRKHSDAFAVDVLTGMDRIFGVNDLVVPMKAHEVASKYPLMKNYIGKGQ